MAVSGCMHVPTHPLSSVSIAGVSVSVCHLRRQAVAVRQVYFNGFNALKISLRNKHPDFWLRRYPKQAFGGQHPSER